MHPHITINLTFNMLWILLLTALIAHSSAIDHNVFKNCSRIPFCTKLRDNQVDKAHQFALQVEDIKILDDSIIIPLNNSKGQTLYLTTYFGPSIPRIKIAEEHSERFELKVGYSLVEVPATVKISHEYIKCPQNTECKQKLRIKPESSEYYIEYVEGPPFLVYFIDADGDIMSILDGERFVMENEGINQAYAFEMKFNSEKLYGLFDHAWNLSLGDTRDTDPLRMRNSDSWGYEANSPMALYGSHPIIYGHSEEYTSGMFLHNAAEQWIDLYKSFGDFPTAYFMVEGAAFDLFVFTGPTPQDVLQQIANLTGKAHMPQLWTLGYHQCRFSYKSQQDVNQVAHLMVEHRFPMDAIWLDGDHTDEYRWFHWNSTTYTDPVDLQKNISSLNKVCVSISDPHIKVESTYDVYAGGVGKYFVKWENGSDYKADCWPGESSWIDFLLPEAADYYGTWYSYEKFNGSTPTLAGIWNDMNEPAIFDDSIEKTLPWETIHRLDNEGKETVRHGDVHNIYGLMHTQATHKGLLKRDDYKKRPFILTRSTFAGSQRVAAMWTGDNTATWEHFANSISQCMTANLLGMPFCGADIGGFIGDPSDELLQRWYQGAVWTPFFRGHSSRESKRREPYLFSEDVQNVLRSAIELRYKHIWHIYGLFFFHTTLGLPIITPLFYQYPGVQERDNQILLGEDIMAIAVTHANVDSVEIVFPGEDHWYRIDDNSWKIYAPSPSVDVPVNIKTSPVFYRAGSVITRKDQVKLSTFEAADDPYYFYVNEDKNGTAKGHFYYDDFTSFDYVTSKQFLLFDLFWDGSKRTLTWMLVDGDLPDFVITVKDIIVHSPNDELQTMKTVFSETKDGQRLEDFNLAAQNLKIGDSYVMYF